MIKGIDVSEFQDKIDFSSVTDIDFVIIRGGYGTNYVDKQAKSNLKGAYESGLLRGVYWFSYAVSEENARMEARKCLEVISNNTLDLPVFWDFEYDSIRYANQIGASITPALVRSMYKAFNEVITAAGFKCGIYANEDYITKYFGEEFIANYPLWYAYWPEKKGACPRDCLIWQYSSYARISGISANVDVNEGYFDFNSEAILPLDGVVNKVVKGYYSNGEERKNKLIAAGYSYSKVQSRVNEYYAAAERVIRGDYGNGAGRFKRLESEGYNSGLVQHIVNVLLCD